MTGPAPKAAPCTPRAHTCRTGLAQRRFQERGRLFLGDEAVGVLETGML